MGTPADGQDEFQTVVPEERPPVPSEPAGLPAPAPVLVPPRLLDAGASFPSEATVIVLERGAITSELRTHAQEGRLVLRILVRADGTPGRVELARSSGIPAFDRSALEAAWSWRFRPATRDGVAIDAWAVVPVRFVVP